MAARITRIRYGDGVSDIIDFEDPDSGFKIVVDGYRPTVAKRKRGALGGERVTRVVDTMLLTVSGASAGAANDRVDLLNAVIDQAQAWRDGAAVHVVTIEYQVEGSALTNPLQAAITGQPPGGDVVQLPFNYDSATSETVIGSRDDPLVFSFERRGEWLGAEETQVATTVENSRLMSIDFASTVSLPSPVRLDCTMEDADAFASGLPIPSSFLLVAPQRAIGDAGIKMNNATVGPKTNFTTVAEGGTHSNSGSIMRFTPPDTDTYDKVSYGASGFGFDDNARLVAIYANMRSNISAVTWNVTGLVHTGYPQNRRRTAINTIEGSEILEPEWVFLGLVSSSQRIVSYGFEVSASTTVGSPVLDFDQIVLQALDGPGSTTIALNETGFEAAQVSNPILKINHRLLERPVPDMIANLLTPSYAGNLITYIGGTSFDMVWLATSGTSWRWYDTAAASIISHTLTAHRRPAYLVPR